MSWNPNLSERESLESVMKSRISLEKIEYMKDLLSSMSYIICILNQKNQIVFFNEYIVEKYGLNLETDILGIRPGEVFRCVNADNDTGGCGTTEKCQYCGAYRTFAQSWEENKKVVNECRIIRNNGANTVQLDLEITATPFVHGGEKYLIVSMQDITEQKRKELIERIFFHDMINVAGGLSNILQLFPSLTDQEREEYLPIASSLSNQIIDEIRAQQQMVKAEKGELQVERNTIRAKQFLEKIQDQIRFNHVAFEKEIEIVDHTDNVSFVSDEVLLTRVLINMAKNALEAISRGQKIRISAKLVENKIRFEVFNATYMKREVQLQLFQRSFSTKGNNRGLGTYSMKLLGEQYLNGRVDFESSTQTGTTFSVELDLQGQSIFRH
jgi:signal transduction histidine kinase